MSILSKLITTGRFIFKGSDFHHARGYCSYMQKEQEEILNHSKEQFKNVAQEKWESKEQKFILAQGIDSFSEPFDVPFTMSDFWGSHFVCLGNSGSGKSKFTETLISQILKSQIEGKDNYNILIIDYKGELVMKLKKIIAVMLSKVSDEKQKRFLKRYGIVDLSSQKYLPEMQILKPDPYLPLDIQSMDIYSTIEATSVDFGIRQLEVIDNALKAGISTGLTFPMLIDFLTNPFFRSSVLKKCPLREVKDFFLYRFDGTSETVGGVISRIKNLLKGGIKAMLSSENSLNPQDFLNKVCLISLAPPYGVESISRVFGTLLFTQIIRAIYNETFASAPKNTLIWIDEVAKMLTKDSSACLEEVVVRARSFGKSFGFILQQPSQLAKYQSTLPDTVMNNCNLQAFFRSSESTAKMISIYLPVSGKELKEKIFPWDQEPKKFMTENEEKHDLIKQTVSLEKGSFWWINRNHSSSAQHLYVLNAPDNKIEEKYQKIPKYIIEELERGCFGRSIQELKQMELKRQQEILEWQQPQFVKESEEKINLKEGSMKENLEVLISSSLPKQSDPSVSDQKKPHETESDGKNVLILKPRKKISPKTKPIIQIG